MWIFQNREAGCRQPCSSRGVAAAGESPSSLRHGDTAWAGRRPGQGAGPRVSFAPDAGGRKPPHCQGIGGGRKDHRVLHLPRPAADASRAGPGQGDHAWAAAIQRQGFVIRIYRQAVHKVRGLLFRSTDWLAHGLAVFVALPPSLESG